MTALYTDWIVIARHKLGKKIMEVTYNRTMGMYSFGVNASWSEGCLTESQFCQQFFNRIQTDAIKGKFWICEFFNPWLVPEIV